MKTTKWSLLGIVLTILGEVGTTSSNVHAAGSAGNAAAESLFVEGKKLLLQGNHLEACRKFEESDRLEVTIGARFQVAQCHELAGRTASAWAGYLEVVGMAKSRGQASREKAARDKAADLEPRVARLIVDVAAASDTPGLMIKRNGVPLARTEWNTPLPVDPGHVALEASAPGRQTSTVLVDVTAATTARKSTYEARIPELEPKGEEPPQLDPTASVDASALSSSQPARLRAAERSRDLRKVAWVGAGTSGLVLGAGVLFTVIALNKKSDSEPHCRGSMCDPTGAALRSDAVGAGDFATVMFVAGAALSTASAALWLLTRPSSEELLARGETTSPLPPRRATATVALGIGGVGVRGSW